ncbi:ATP12 family protein [Mesorhizobium sp. Z1-4]|uniref:ATP12 family chaperone protein n=1 Tax=Mesorhizobium sp. Z1-4 TaxID=2448478 RepID=UPI000FD90985|nr:ATP12 family protein [Mesorhizobium sp. Z1-4]
MRDLLNDLEAGRAAQRDPNEAARESMRVQLPKRFYKVAGFEAEDAGFSVRLDGKQVRTPGRKPLILPTAGAARLVAGEFDAQGEKIDPMTMPATRLVNTAIDGVANDVQAVLEDILRYASSDLICYRADTPQELVQRQGDAWDPVLDWLQGLLGARFILAEGVMPVEQPRETIAVLGAYLAQRREPFRIAALHVMTSLMGSALLALAVDAGELDVERAWTAAHIDEDWNTEQWGEDTEAASRRAQRLLEMRAAGALVATLDAS